MGASSVRSLRQRAESSALPAPEFAPFQDEPPQMQSGAVGKTRLPAPGLRAARRTDTILADLERRAPYLAQRALLLRLGDAGSGLASS